MGYASAMAWLLFLVIMIVTGVQLIVSRRLVYYEGDSDDRRRRRPAVPQTRRRTSAGAGRPPPRHAGGGRAAPARGAAAARSAACSHGSRLALLGVVFIYPFIWLVSASFKPRGEVFDNALIPKTFTLDNYVTVWQEAPLASLADEHR